MKERLLLTIKEKVQATIGWGVDWKINQFLKDNGKDGELVLVKNGETYVFPTAIKKEYRNHHLLSLMETKNQYGQLAVIGETIPASLKQQLRANHISYIDGAGNIYLERKGLFVLIQGQKHKTRKEEYRHRAFTKSGLKVIFHLLLDKDLINTVYRTIAKTAGVSIDTVSKTISSLRTLGFIIRLDKQRLKLHQQKQLLERWIYQYGDKLKPSLFIGKFRQLTGTGTWETIEFTNSHTQWGAEPAAELLTNYLRAELLTLYTEEKIAVLMKQYRLVPDEEGKISVYKKFWNKALNTDKTVPPLLVYADLIYSGDARNLETAKRLYEQQLQNLF